MELLVVVAIITIIMAIVLTGQGMFNKTLLLETTAYDVTLALRDAETYGIGSRAAGTVTNAGYGIHFTPGDSFTLFADTYPTLSTCHPNTGLPNAEPGNCVYDANNGETVHTYTLGNGITVSSLCVFNGSWSCSGTSSLDIVFSRPNPVAFISKNGLYSSLNTQACLTLASPQGTTRYLSIVAATGEITADAPSCP